MSQQTVSLQLPRGRARELQATFENAGYTFSSAPDALWRARGDCVATLYASGKLVVQGRLVEPWVLAAEELGGTVAKWSGRDAADAEPPPSGPTRASGAAGRFAAAIAKLPAPAPTAWIGIDEAGKGDYFGPLVVVAARVELDQLPLLAELGVADSKSITDKRAHELAATLRHVVPHASVVLMPARYNDLYARIGNLNHLLAWAHAAAAEKLLESGVEAELILSDQFSKANLVGRRLKERSRQLRYVQRTRAEEDPAVACASIFARAAFLRGLEELGQRFGVRLAKGAGPPVLDAGRRIVREQGRALLGDVAKLHFKTTESLG